MPHELSAGDSLSIVLPVYRNREQLPELLARLETMLTGTGLAWEIVCVEDGGGDGSREWLAERAASDERLVLVANPCNLGQHAAIVRGLRAARGGRVVVMDADLQDAPEDVPTLLAAWRPGLGAVFARRSAAYQPAQRDWTGRQFKRLVRRLVGPGLPVGVGTFVLLGAEARERIAARDEARPYLPLAIVRTGLLVESVAIEKRGRSARRSAYSALARLRLAWQALRAALGWRLGRP